MLKRLKLHRFRYIKPGTELMFTERFNVLLGRNGTGKTTLLDLISMVLRSDFSALKDEEFDIEYEWSLEGGTGVVRFENKLKPLPLDQATSTSRAGGKRRQHHPHVIVVLHLDGMSKDDKCEIRVDGAAMQWRQGSRAWEGSAVVDISRLFSALVDDLPFTDPYNHATLLMNDFGRSGLRAYRFDESLALFESITTDDPGGPSDHWRAPAFVPEEYGAYPEPGKLSINVALPTQSSLAKFPGLAGVKNMSMSLAIDRTWQQPDGSEWCWGAARFVFSGTGGALFSHHGLSYGQKRLLAFLYYLDANPAFVVADELVNGMHHDWIRACLDEIGARQAFLTSQNPLLLDYLPLESVEQIQKTFIQCRTEIVDDEPQIVWSNLAADDAAELFADYKVGIQPVGEILRARGLW